MVLLALSLIVNVVLVYMAMKERESLLNRIQAPEREIYKPRRKGAMPAHVNPFLDEEWDEHKAELNGGS